VRFESDRRYQLPVSPTELWAALTRLDRYQLWWPWLREFDAQLLAGDETWDCLVQPPLPYRVRFVVALEEVTAPTTVRASITGDVVGEARLDIVEQPDGSEARLVSTRVPASSSTARSERATLLPWVHVPEHHNTAWVGA
jgi:hypothetical protein